MDGEGGGEGDVRSIPNTYISNMSLLLGIEPFQKFAMGGWWSKGNLEFRFCPNLGLRLEAWTKLNKMSMI